MPLHKFILSRSPHSAQSLEGLSYVPRWDESPYPPTQSCCVAMNVTSVQKPVLLLGHDLVRHLTSQPASSFPVGCAQCWVPWIPHCPVQNLCSLSHPTVRMQMKWKNEWMYKGMIVRPCWGAENRGPWHQGLAPPHDWGWPCSSSQLHFAFCLRLIRRYVTLILEIAWDGTCFHSMAWTWGFYSSLK